MRKSLLLTAVSVALSVSLAGCVTPGAQRATYLNTLVGHPELDLVRAMGVPSRTFETSGIKYFAYKESRIETLPGTWGGGGYGGWGWHGYGWGGGWGGFPPEVVKRDCETTFELTGGVVKSWTLRGNDCN